MRRGASRARPAGTGILIGPELAAAAEVEFFQCCHCGRHHAMRSSIDALIKNPQALGYCASCDGVHCPGCSTCVPIERQLDNVEAGRHKLDISRVSIAVPRDIV